MGNYDFELNLEENNTMSIINSWINEGTCVLEFGPANGRLTKHLSLNKNCEMTIVEIDEEAGSEAATYAKAAYIGNEKGDITKFYWCDGTRKYDYIIFADVLEHLPNPKEVLDKCKEVLKPKGNILISIPNLSHNSVIIDLWNDNFFYQKTGLLDSTHIHFFTYNSFLRIIEDLDYTIDDLEFVFSRVGWNELNNKYSDIPIEVEKQLRKRTFGSVYQYVAKLQLNGDRSRDYDGNRKTTLIDFFDEEILCFSWEDIKNPENYEYTGIKYKDDGLFHDFVFEISPNVTEIRIDPMKNSCVVEISDVYISDGKENKHIDIVDSNALLKDECIYFFTDDNPWFLIRLSQNGTAESLCVRLRILESHLSEKEIELYNKVSKMNPGIDINEVKALETALQESHRYIERLENEHKEKNKYIEHIESDISQLKKEIERLESELNP